MFKCAKCGKFIWSIRKKLCDDCRIAQAVQEQVKQIRGQETKEADVSQKEAKESGLFQPVPIFQTQNKTSNQSDEKRNVHEAKSEAIEKEHEIEEKKTYPQEIPKAIYPSFEGFTLSHEQCDAFGRIENTPYNYFITGNAGTGKSVVLRYFIQHTKKNVAVVAPTGIAAINVGGETIHSFFGLSIDVQDAKNVSAIKEEMAKSSALCEKLRKIDTVVIDEVSMVRCDIMDMIDAKLKVARRSSMPFGGCQIIAFGDLYQLPPVVAEKSVGEYIKDHYFSEYFFRAPVVVKNPFIQINLTQTHRQTDQAFIDALNGIRVGENTVKYIDYINAHACQNQKHEDSITLTPDNATANRINQNKIDALQTAECVYYADIDNEQEFKSEKDYPAARVLKLKVGAKVMMIRNDQERRWVNGSVGHIVALTSNAITVRIKGRQYDIDRETWQKYKYQYDRQEKKLKREIVAKFTQFPIRLAYAITIHKSQGKTYENIEIDYSGMRGRNKGQTYVALSRCKTVEGITLTTPLTPEDITISSEVSHYMHDANCSVPDYLKNYSTSVGGGQMPFKRQVNIK